MKLHKLLLGAVAAMLVLGQVTASACFIPICLPNPGNCGPHPVVSPVCPVRLRVTASHDVDDKPPCIPIVVIILKSIFGCISNAARLR
jgi:hypothetical protein